MAIQPDVEHAESHLSIRPCGVYAREDVFPMSRQVLDERQQYGLSKILVDTAALNMDAVSQAEAAFIAHHILQTFLATRDTRIAFVVDPDTKKALFDALFDVVASQKGDGLSVFADQSEALDWLLR